MNVQVFKVVSDGPPLWAEKDKDSALNYTFLLDAVLSDGDVLVSCDWVVAPYESTQTPVAPVVVTGRRVDPTMLHVALSGGDPGLWVSVIGTYSTKIGNVGQAVLRLLITADEELSRPMGTVLFPNRYAAVARLQTGHMAIAAKAGLNVSSLGEEYLWEKLQVAESEIARKLGVFLGPTEVFAGWTPTAAETASLGLRPYVVDPGFDLPPDWLQLGSFGGLKLGRPAVSAITTMKLRHPSIPGEVFVIPPSWIQLTPRGSYVNVLPAGAGVQGLPLALFQLQAMGSGYTVPQMIQVRYTAGLQPGSPHLAEIRDLAMRLSNVAMLTDAMTPQSGSISADGLSQSTSQDAAKHQDAIDARLATLRDAIVGPIWAVL